MFFPPHKRALRGRACALRRLQTNTEGARMGGEGGGQQKAAAASGAWLPSADAVTWSPGAAGLHSDIMIESTTGEQSQPLIDSVAIRSRVLFAV